MDNGSKNLVNEPITCAEFDETFRRVYQEEMKAVQVPTELKKQVVAQMNAYQDMLNV
jgi:hypothetical protein